MPQVSVYCDESCHLERDHRQAMVLGAVWAPTELIPSFSRDLKHIKERHRVARHIELKWTKISPARLALYVDVINYFFDNGNLHFRAIIIPDKTLLDHGRFNQDHDAWYYKMYFRLLEQVLSPSDQYEIYIDIKDTLGGLKVTHLENVLRNSKYDFSMKIIKRLQIVRSHEIQLLQLADILTGAVSAANRTDTTSEAKRTIIELVRERSGYALTRTTLLRESKFNLLNWTAA